MITIDTALRSSKAAYQEIKANGESLLASLFHRSYSPEEVIKKLRSNLGLEKHTRVPLDRPIRILLLASINNWEVDLLPPLRELGELMHVNWESVGFFQTQTEWLDYRAMINHRMRSSYDQFAEGGHIDVVVGYCSDFNTDPSTLEYMRRRGSVVLNFCWDDKLYFKSSYRGQHTGVGRIARSVDLNLTNAPSSIPKYQRVGALALFWPEAANPVPLTGIEEEICTDYDVLFVGGRYGWRGEFVERLISDGIRVRTYGNGWSNGPLPGEKLLQMYRQSPAVLGFSGVGYSKKLKCLKGRDFEVPMAAGLYLTQHNPELSLVYEVGSEILTYHSYQDCKQKISWIQKHPDESSRIRNAGHIRAIRSHTWKKRFEDVFRVCGLIPLNYDSASEANTHRI